MNDAAIAVNAWFSNVVGKPLRSRVARAGGF
jgi:hypothetical protein